MKLFKDEIFIESGFYRLFHKDGTIEDVYVSEKPNDHGYHDSRIRSFFAVTPNTRDKNTCHDFGLYVWVNHYRLYGPIGWEPMTSTEVEEFKKQLYRFDRPKFTQ